MNILNELNEEYFYLFDNNNNHNYYYNYSNKGLITLIKCLVSLFQYKFGVIENKLNDIYNNIKKENNNDKSHNKSKNYSNDFNNVINKNRKITLANEKNKIESKVINANYIKKIDNYNSEENQKRWETMNLENAKAKHKIFFNNLYNKEKSLEFFHNRRKSNHEIKKRSLDIKNISNINYNDNYIKNELFFLGDAPTQSRLITRNNTDIRYTVKQNINFPSFILQKKKNIEQKIKYKMII
jgi:hypothetical protein